MRFVVVGAGSWGQVFAKWDRQRCQPAPISTEPIASRSPSSASETTSFTPDRPRATSERRNASQPAVLGGNQVGTKDLALPIGVDAGGDNDRALHDLAPSRTFWVSASSHR